MIGAAAYLGQLLDADHGEKIIRAADRQTPIATSHRQSPEIVGTAPRHSSSLNAGRSAVFHARLGSGEELERQRGEIDFSVHVSAVSCPCPARRVTECDAAIWLPLGEKRTSRGYRKSVARDP
jgi:hypothetical protein